MTTFAFGGDQQSNQNTFGGFSFGATARYCELGFV